MSINNDNPKSWHDAEREKRHVMDEMERNARKVREEASRHPVQPRRQEEAQGSSRMMLHAPPRKVPSAGPPPASPGIPVQFYCWYKGKVSKAMISCLSAPSPEDD